MVSIFRIQTAKLDPTVKEVLEQYPANDFSSWLNYSVDIPGIYQVYIKLNSANNNENKDIEVKAIHTLNPDDLIKKLAYHLLDTESLNNPGDNQDYSMEELCNNMPGVEQLDFDGQSYYEDFYTTYSCYYKGTAREKPEGAHGAGEFTDPCFAIYPLKHTPTNTGVSHKYYTDDPCSAKHTTCALDEKILARIDGSRYYYERSLFPTKVSQPDPTQCYTNISLEELGLKMPNNSKFNDIKEAVKFDILTHQHMSHIFAVPIYEGDIQKPDSYTPEVDKLLACLRTASNEVNAAKESPETSWFLGYNYILSNISGGTQGLSIAEFETLLQASVGGMLVIPLTDTNYEYLRISSFSNLLLKYSTLVALVFVYDPDSIPCIEDELKGIGLDPSLAIYSCDIIETSRLSESEKESLKTIFFSFSKDPEAFDETVKKFARRHKWYKKDSPAFLSDFRDLCERQYHRNLTLELHEIEDKLKNPDINEDEKKKLEERKVSLSNILAITSKYNLDSDNNYDPIKNYQEELNSSVGLENVKKAINNIITVLDRRTKRDLLDIECRNVYTFEGNPGCGKTTVARKFAYILKQNGILTGSGNPFVEKTIGELVGTHLGEAANYVSAAFEEAKGKVLFIDEAYSLLDQGQYGDSALAAIVACISKMTSDSVLILAGYPDKMTQLLKRNAGLESRITQRIIFDDYSCEELWEILKKNLKERYQFTLANEEEAKTDILRLFRTVSSCNDKDAGKTLGNARFIDNLMNKLELEHAKYMYDVEASINYEEVYDKDAQTQLNNFIFANCEVFNVEHGVAKVVEDAIREFEETGSTLGSCRPPYFVPTREDDTFDNIIGNDEVKNELRKQIELFKDTSDDSLSMRGILLTGAPGCGKTSLARTFAKESNSAFLYVNASDLIKGYSGQTNAAVTELFDECDKYSKCTLFIDEIDAIGMDRRYHSQSNASEALYPLLNRLGNNGSNKKLFIIATTNCPEQLDPALLRRLGKQFTVSLPNKDNIKKLIKHQLNRHNIQLGDEILETTAKDLVGKSPDDINQLINDTLITIKMNKESSSSFENVFKEKIDVALYGTPKPGIIAQEMEKNYIAVHELGHAIIHYKTGTSKENIRISLVPRGDALGLTISASEASILLETPQHLEDSITVLLGGRAAEELEFGPTCISSGCSNDLERATQLATVFIANCGMGSSLRVRDTNDPSVLSEVDTLLEKCYKRAKQILSDNKDIVERGKKLLENQAELSGIELFN